MEKLARKPSSDPVQEKLRKDKDLWNKQVSQFIESVKQVKKTMNGYPSKLNPQKGNIKEPLPESVHTALEALTTAFDQLAQSGEAIVQEQLEYSKNRRKSQPKAPTGPVATPTAPTTPAPGGEMSGADLSKQLTAWETKYEMIVEGSNPLTRFWARMTNPSIGWGQKAELRRARMRWLKSCAKAFKALENFQVAIVSGGKDSIPKASTLAQNIWDLWVSVARGYVNLRNKLPKDSVPEEKDVPIVDHNNPEETTDQLPTLQDGKLNAPQFSPDQHIAVILKDYYEAVMQGKFPAEPALLNMQDVVDKMTMSPNDKGKFGRQLYSSWGATIRALNAKYQVNGRSLMEIAKLKETKEAPTMPATPPVVPPGTPAPGEPDPNDMVIPPATDGKTSTAALESTAQAFLKKWLGKKRYQLSFDDTANDRIQLFDLAEEMRNILDEVMNQLEKGLDPSQMNSVVNQMNSKTQQFRGMMRALNNLHNEKKRK